MSEATLLVHPLSQDGRAQFIFEHTMAHKVQLGVMGNSPGLSAFSTIPYFIAPRPGPYGPTPPPLIQDDRKYLQFHQQAHNDANVNLPSQIVQDATGQWWEVVDIGIPQHNNLQDVELNDSAQMMWWTFANHQEHLAHSQSAYPLIEWVFPFW
jgi:hypothetical protein